jgi:gluconokinase
MGLERLALMVGTTGAMRLLWTGEAVSPPAGLWLYRLDRARVLLGGALSEGGNVFEWLNERMRLPEKADLGQALSALPPDGHGLTWLPFLVGERSPNWRGDARAAIVGLRLTTTPVEILRAALESIAYRFALILDLIDEAMPAPGGRTLVASGNALLSDPVWLQIVADTFGRSIVASREPEASLRGAGLIALERLGAVTDLARVAGLVIDGGATFEPDEERHAIYRAAMARQQDLYRALLG